MSTRDTLARDLNAICDGWRELYHRETSALSALLGEASEYLECAEYRDRESAVAALDLRERIRAALDARAPVREHDEVKP